jgi:hypothetical protein
MSSSCFEYLFTLPPPVVNALDGVRQDRGLADGVQVRVHAMIFREDLHVSLIIGEHRTHRGVKHIALRQQLAHHGPGLFAVKHGASPG